MKGNPGLLAPPNVYGKMRKMPFGPLSDSSVFALIHFVCVSSKNLLARLCQRGKCTSLRSQTNTTVSTVGLKKFHGWDCFATLSVVG